MAAIAAIAVIRETGRDRGVMCAVRVAVWKWQCVVRRVEGLKMSDGGVLRKRRHAPVRTQVRLAGTRSAHAAVSISEGGRGWTSVGPSWRGNFVSFRRLLPRKHRGLTFVHAGGHVGLFGRRRSSAL